MNHQNMTTLRRWHQSKPWAWASQGAHKCQGSKGCVLQEICLSKESRKRGRASWPLETLWVRSQRPWRPVWSDQESPDGDPSGDLASRTWNTFNFLCDFGQVASYPSPLVSSIKWISGLMFLKNSCCKSPSLDGSSWRQCGRLNLPT